MCPRCTFSILFKNHFYLMLPANSQCTIQVAMSMELDMLLDEIFVCTLQPHYSMVITPLRLGSHCYLSCVQDPHYNPFLL